MPVISSKIDVAGEAFARNRAHMLSLIETLRGLEARAREKSAQAKPLFDRRGQLLPRERVARLLDIGAPWLDLSSIAGMNVVEARLNLTFAPTGMGYASEVPDATTGNCSATFQPLSTSRWASPPRANGHCPGSGDSGTPSRAV